MIILYNNTMVNTDLVGKIEIIDESEIWRVGEDAPETFSCIRFHMINKIKTLLDGPVPMMMDICSVPKSNKNRKVLEKVTRDIFNAFSTDCKTFDANISLKNNMEVIR